ncbi:hypothetical protein ACEN2J_20010 [Pseudorhodobacter sp. W20_MBD10_FR17]|uniref:hypothetical protein n=1 Tax=Pseudorhodobacter sp. W20_MBD10_FR17 TaxID=3240266 RepID=UPI003F962DD2
MKKLLATTAVAMIAMSGTASAQSVLERVLGQIDNATNLASVNGTFANIAENIGGTSAQTVWLNTTGNVITDAEYQAAAAEQYQSDYTSAVATTDYIDPTTLTVLTPAQYAALSTADQAAYQLVSTTAGYFTDGSTVLSTASKAALVSVNPYASYTSDVIQVSGLDGVNGSINNVVDGITDATQTAVAGVVSAVEYNMPTLNFGDMATTALGAVNTGDITLGVNSSVDNAKTTSTEAVSSVMAQLGGSADTGAIVLNIASNMTGINGSINNAMTEVNGTVGNLSTTALGAVNTGTIISGVNAAVTGITGASAGQ